MRVEHDRPSCHTYSPSGWRNRSDPDAADTLPEPPYGSVRSDECPGRAPTNYARVSRLSSLAVVPDGGRQQGHSRSELSYVTVLISPRSSTEGKVPSLVRHLPLALVPADRPPPHTRSAACADRDGACAGCEKFPYSGQGGLRPLRSLAGPVRSSLRCGRPARRRRTAESPATPRTRSPQRGRRACCVAEQRWCVLRPVLSSPPPIISTGDRHRSRPLTITREKWRLRGKALRLIICFVG
jgi:hypothetical protein